MASPGTHIVFDRGSARPRPWRGVPAEIYRGACVAMLRLWGWKIEGDWPDDPKMVLIAAPHTSNWDGIWMLAAASYWRVSLRYTGKKSLTEGPFGWLVKWTGCIPVDRSRAADLVGQMRDAFAAAPGLILAVPPEGTRGRVEKWKSGFYHIAVAANVPIVMSVLDYGSKTIRMSGLLWPTGDYAADFALIRTHYEGAQGKIPGDFTLAI
jgi:1-acyl-sn-glycerol-3-phosphate acyltransferase